MKVLSCILTNFGSYKRLELPALDEGLTLLQGPTGSGKSTLCDALPWVLFGKTAKNGTVDEVLSWQADGEPTIGTCVVDCEGHKLSVTRKRGKGNDLWLNLDDGPAIRGKDLADTQRKIDAALGMTCELYLSGAYYHEFSQTAQFFTATAKNRRALLEQIVDLSIPITLQEEMRNQAKGCAESIGASENTLRHAESTLTAVAAAIRSTTVKKDSWDVETDRKLMHLEDRSKGFEREKASTIEALSQEATAWDERESASIEKLENQLEVAEREALDVSYCKMAIDQLEAELLSARTGVPCAHCGTVIRPDNYDSMVEALAREKVAHTQAVAAGRKVKTLQESLDKREANPYSAQLQHATAQTNPYPEQIAAMEAEINPYDAMLADHISVRAETMAEIKSETAHLERLRQTQCDIALLQDVVSNFRALLVRNTIAHVQDQANALLSKHFDGEISLTLEVHGDDKLEVALTKNGFPCSFTQLSKGQRQMLKLCFGIAVIKGVANHHGIRFSTIWFDEAFDGLDDQFKIKAFGLLQALALDYKSVFVVEHSSELKVMFETRYDIMLTPDGSVVEKST